ncbi:hypothetical protein C0J52_22876 [Blattella germanica]|nr:hypothetical protein C0J52_22876 [Blattella germanica]
MGCFMGSDAESQGGKRISRKLEKKIKEWSKDYEKAIKILLLGTGESGKTTIIKQMKILHISGFSENDRHEKVTEIRQNVHESIHDLVIHMPVLRPPVTLADKANEASASFIRNLGPAEPASYTQEYYDHVAKLWRDKGIQQCFWRSNEFQLIDSTKYFLDRLEEVRKPSYRPTDQDILYSRKKTTGIQKIEFEMKVSKKFGGGNVDFWMFDVGGQRSERRKWLQEATQKKHNSEEERKSSVLPGLKVTLAQNKNRQCYFHFTVATDTGNIKTVFEDVHSMILMSVLSEFGLQ